MPHTRWLGDDVGLVVLPRRNSPLALRKVRISESYSRPGNSSFVVSSRCQVGGAVARHVMAHNRATKMIWLMFGREELCEHKALLVWQLRRFVRLVRLVRGDAVGIARPFAPLGRDAAPARQGSRGFGGSA